MFYKQKKLFFGWWTGNNFLYKGGLRFGQMEEYIEYSGLMFADRMNILYRYVIYLYVCLLQYPSLTI